jgi:hypothetical protein
MQRRGSFSHREPVEVSGPAEAAGQVLHAAALVAALIVDHLHDPRFQLGHSLERQQDVTLARSNRRTSSAGRQIEQLVRDGNTATQHMILAETHLDILGRLLLGQDAGTPII